MKLKDLVIVIVMMKMIAIPQDNSKEINLYIPTFYITEFKSKEKNFIE